jgi:predicted ABC-class ATPase
LRICVAHSAWSGDASTYASLAEAYGRAAQHCRKQAQQREFRRLLEDCGRNIQLIANGSNHPDRIGELLTQVDNLIAGPFPVSSS